MIYTVTLYVNGADPLREPDVEARSPRHAARKAWSENELDYATALVEAPGVERRFIIEPVTAARVIDVPDPGPARPLPEQARRVVAGSVVRAPDSKALAHLRETWNDSIHVYADQRCTPGTSRGVLRWRAEDPDRGGPCDVLAVFDYVHRYEDPADWGLGSFACRSAEVIERATGLRGWAYADRLEVIEAPGESSASVAG